MRKFRVRNLSEHVEHFHRSEKFKHYVILNKNSIIDTIILMMRLSSILCFVLAMYLCNCAAEYLICRNTADDLTFCGDSQNCKETTNRIKVLEEQVRQLQSVIEKDAFKDRRTRYTDTLADCGEILANGTSQSGVYMISPEGRCPFSVYCDMTDDGWTVIQRRIDGAVNFYRTWDEYVQGFGDIDGEYWLGLEKIHRLTKDGTEIYFDIENYDGTREYAHYKSFTVHGTTTIYKMNVDAHGYKGTLAELFSHHNDQKFTTFDRDNDFNDSNCAKDFDGGGWWYKSCYKLGNPNGVFGKREGGGIGYWDDVRKTVFVRTFTIKVRQIVGAC